MSEEITKENFDALKSFWIHMLRRIQLDSNIQYYCGAMTETLRLCLDVYIAFNPNANRKEIERGLLENNRASEADVLTLRQEIKMKEERGDF